MADIILGKGTEEPPELPISGPAWVDAHGNLQEKPVLLKMFLLLICIVYVRNPHSWCLRICQSANAARSSVPETRRSTTCTRLRGTVEGGINGYYSDWQISKASGSSIFRTLRRNLPGEDYWINSPSIQMLQKGLPSREGQW